ncbi:MAG: leucyl aminopeptidase [Bacteroidota bacterium]
MTIRLSENTPEQSSLIIPLVAGAHLPASLEAISQKFGLTNTSIAQHFKATKGAVIPLYPNNLQNIFLLGLGSQVDAMTCLSAFQGLSHQYKKQLSKTVCIDWEVAFANSSESELARWIEAGTNGLLLGTYAIGKYKSQASQGHPLQQESAGIYLNSPFKESAALLSAASAGRQTADTQMRILDMVNAPGNKLRPIDMAHWVAESAQRHHYKVRIIEKEEAQKIGLQALLAVNRGSEWPPAFIIAEYEPSENSGDLPHFGLVGKGVTFDTGGLSIKGANNMHYMKSDMGGAAAVLGSIELCARLQIPARVTAIVPTTDNCVDAMSIKPGDIIGSYSGKTIEVIDTDAEGRLILADGLAYMEKHFAPDVMIDLATLTGSCVRALGYHAAGLFTQNDQLADALREAARVSGEGLWRLPLWEAYQKDLESDVADIKNLGGPVAGAITAAKFLENFTSHHPCWAHMDIAGVAFGNSIFSQQKSATAYGIRLLTQLIRSWKP